MQKYFSFFGGAFWGVWVMSGIGSEYWFFGLGVLLYWFLLRRECRWLIVLGLILGMGRMWWADFGIYDERFVGNFYGEEVVFEGVIDDVDERRDHVKLRVRSEDFKGGVLLRTARFPRFSYGDVVKVRGVIEAPRDVEGFSYRNYLSLQEVYGIMYRPFVEKVRHDGMWWYSQILEIREYVVETFEKFLPEPFASFEAALVVGDRKGISEHLLEAFRRTGLTHVIAISGYNITLLLVVVGYVVQRWALGARVFFSVMMVLFFMVLAGGSAAVVRASLMGVLGLCALYLGRKNAVLLMIGWSAFFMVMLNPRVLLFDLGFQLSFLAVLGLALMMPFFEKRGLWLPKVLGVREAFLTTVAAQVLVLPLILMMFGEVPLISLVANVVVAPLLPLAMFGGIVLALCSWVPWCAEMCAFFVMLCLKVVILCIEFFAKIPLMISFPGITWWWVCGYYFFVVRKCYNLYLDAIKIESG